MSLTIVSIVPFAINERKPLTPAYYVIDKASFDEPKVLPVHDAISFVNVGENRGSFGEGRSILKLPVPAKEVAEAVIGDFSGSLMGVQRGEAEPGLFIVDGVVGEQEVRPKYQPQLDIAQARQFNWFKELVRLADDDWNRYGRHKMISDLQRYAGRELRMERPWLLEQEITAAVTVCPSCFEKVNPKAVVCAQCRYVLNTEAHAKLTYATA